MRIMFVDTVEGSRHCLKKVLKNGGNVVAVFTLAKEYAGFHSDYADLSDVAIQHGIPVHRIKNVNDPENVTLIRSLKPDVVFVFGWSQLISNFKRNSGYPAIGLHWDTPGSIAAESWSPPNYLGTGWGIERKWPYFLHGRRRRWRRHLVAEVVPYYSGG